MAKKTTNKKTTKKAAKKTARKKSAAAKTTKKKTATKKSSKATPKKKAAAKKSTSKRKATAKPAAKKKTSTKKTSPKKTATRKSAAKPTTGRKKTAKSTSSPSRARTKPAAPAPATPPPAAKPAKPLRPLSPKDVEECRQMLVQKRAEILGDMNTLSAESLNANRQDAAGDLSSMPIHMADLGSDNYELEFTLGLIEGERAILREIDEALERIREGTYGFCLATGNPIGKARLQAKPWAKYCYEYTLAQERGQTHGF